MLRLSDTNLSHLLTNVIHPVMLYKYVCLVLNLSMFYTRLLPMVGHSLNVVVLIYPCSYLLVFSYMHQIHYELHETSVSSPILHHNIKS